MRGLLLITLLAAAVAQPAYNYSFTPVWPLPSSLSVGQSTVLLSSAFVINDHQGYTFDSNSLLGRIAIRYTASIRATTWVPEYLNTQPTSPKSGQITCLTVSVSSSSETLTPTTAESYTLHVPAGGVATLTAVNVFGALRGLQTFSQLVRARLTDHHLEVPYLPITITDAPAFPHRGIMLDTARHYFPVSDIQRTLDGMVQVKLNVLHWHITDSQSFPLLSSAVPELAQKGAYKKRGVLQVYNSIDIANIVRYGYERGIRVIPEVDMPGHTRSWAFSHPELTTCVGSNFEVTAAEPPAGQLDPINANTYNLINKLFDDVAPQFLDTYWHAGGDEVNFNCWNTSASIRQYLVANNLQFNDLVHQFANKIYSHLKGLGKTVVLWEEMLLQFGVQPPAGSVVNTWQGVQSVQNVTAAGYSAVVTDYNNWYLDCGHGDFPGSGPSWCDPYKTWMVVYSFDVLANLTAKQAKHVLGGEVSLWTEQTSPQNLDRMLWPRSAAAAEALWSGKDASGEVRNWVPATPRLWELNERLILSGIQSEPLQPTYCATNDCYESATSAY